MVYPTSRCVAPKKTRKISGLVRLFIMIQRHLLPGLDLTNALTGVLCRFRQYPIPVMCDVEKMFLNRDYMRFLWWEDGNLDIERSEYRMREHLFGAASSSVCANYGIKILARNQEKLFPTASFFCAK